MATREVNMLRRTAARGAKERLERARAKQQTAIIAVNFMEWSQKVPEPKGPLDFARFPFQVEMYQEESERLREVVVKKATQIGVSAYLIRQTIYYADVRGWTALYVFPRAKQVYDQSDARVKPLLDGDYLRGRVPRGYVQNKGLKQIGLGFVYYRGSESKRAVDAVDADVLALDEYDELAQENIPDAERRVSGSLHGLIRRVGVPSIAEYGITASYEASDQRRWLTKCPGCNTWQTVDFWENVDQDQELVVCSKCRKGPLPVEDGEWVAAFPDRSVRGYHASRLIVPRIARNENESLTQIIAASKKTKPYEITAFMNKDLAEDYSPEEGRLSPAALAAAQSAGGEFFQVSGYAGTNPVTMGVDVASTRNLNVRISEHLPNRAKRALFIGEVASFDEVVELMRRFRVNMAAIDHLPEGRLARAVAERFPGMVYLVNYAAQKELFKVDDMMHTVSVRRTEAIDAMMAIVREQRNHLPQDLPEGYSSQMKALVRHTTIDDNDRVVVGYKSTGATDYAQAETYDVVATDLLQYRLDVGTAAEGEPELRPMEDALEFRRSALSDPTVGYSPGPDTGMDPEEWDDGDEFME